jgi:hypothetical protein
MTAALEGGEWSAALPGRALPPGKTRYPLYRGLGGPQGRSGRAKDLVPTGIRSRTVQPVVSIVRLTASLKLVANLRLCSQLIAILLHLFKLRVSFLACNLVAECEGHTTPTRHDTTQHQTQNTQ